VEKSKSKKTTKPNKNKKKGLDKFADGMFNEEIETNIKLITSAYYALKNNPDTFVEEQVLDANDVAENIDAWLNTTVLLNRTESYAAVVSLEGVNYDHAVLLKAVKKDAQTLEIKLIDPLPKENDMFKQQADELVNDLAEHFGDENIQYIYSGRQCKDSATCGDMSLIMLQETLEKNIKSNQSQLAGDMAGEKLAVTTPELLSYNPLGDNNKMSPNGIEGAEAKDTSAYVVREELKSNGLANNNAQVDIQIITPSGKLFVPMTEREQKTENQLKYYADNGVLFETARKALADGFKVVKVAKTVTDDQANNSSAVFSNIASASTSSLSAFNFPAVWTAPVLSVRDSLSFTLNPKLRAQAEYYLQMGTMFDLFREAVHSGQVDISFSEGSSGLISTVLNHNNQSIESSNNVSLNNPNCVYDDKMKPSKPINLSECLEQPLSTSNNFNNQSKINIQSMIDDYATAKTNAEKAEDNNVNQSIAVKVNIAITTPFGTPFITLNEYDEKLKIQLEHYALTGQLFDSAREAIDRGYRVELDILEVEEVEIEEEKQAPVTNDNVTIEDTALEVTDDLAVNTLPVLPISAEILTHQLEDPVLTAQREYRNETGVSFESIQIYEHGRVVIPVDELVAQRSEQLEAQSMVTSVLSYIREVGTDLLTGVSLLGMCIGKQAAGFDVLGTAHFLKTREIKPYSEDGQSDGYASGLFGFGGHANHGGDDGNGGNNSNNGLNHPVDLQGNVPQRILPDELLCGVVNEAEHKQQDDYTITPPDLVPTETVYYAVL
jgi:hypothetical protein